MLRATILVLRASSVQADAARRFAVDVAVATVKVAIAVLTVGMLIASLLAKLDTEPGRQA
jgi:hypothetical protein